MSITAVLVPSFSRIAPAGPDESEDAVLLEEDEASLEVDELVDEL